MTEYQYSKDLSNTVLVDKCQHPNLQAVLVRAVFCVIQEYSVLGIRPLGLRTRENKEDTVQNTIRVQFEIVLQAWIFVETVKCFRRLLQSSDFSTTDVPNIFEISLAVNSTGKSSCWQSLERRR